MHTMFEGHFMQRNHQHTKYKNGKCMALNGLGKEFLVTVWELEVQGSLVGCQLGTCALGDSNVLQLCACPSTAVKEPWVLFWGQQGGGGGINCLYTYFLKKSNSARGFYHKNTPLSYPIPIHLPPTPTSTTWFPSSGQPVSLVSCISF